MESCQGEGVPRSAGVFACVLCQHLYFLRDHRSKCVLQKIHKTPNKQVKFTPIRLQWVSCLLADTHHLSPMNTCDPTSRCFRGCFPMAKDVRNASLSLSFLPLFLADGFRHLSSTAPGLKFRGSPQVKYVLCISAVVTSLKLYPVLVCLYRHHS